MQTPSHQRWIEFSSRWRRHHRHLPEVAHNCSWAVSMRHSSASTGSLEDNRQRDELPYFSRKLHRLPYAHMRINDRGLLDHP